MEHDKESAIEVNQLWVSQDCLRAVRPHNANFLFSVTGISGMSLANTIVDVLHYPLQFPGFSQCFCNIQVLLRKNVGTHSGGLFPFVKSTRAPYLSPILLLLLMILASNGHDLTADAALA